MENAAGKPNGPRMVKASEFKARCLKLMDEVAENGEEIVITKNGKPVAKLTAFQDRPKTFFGVDKDRLEILGDIISPIDVEWEAELGLIDGKPADKPTTSRERPKTLFGAGRGRMKILGDIISPLDVEWEAQSDPDRVINP